MHSVCALNQVLLRYQSEIAATTICNFQRWAAVYVTQLVATIWDTPYEISEDSPPSQVGEIQNEIYSVQVDLCICMYTRAYAMTGSVWFPLPARA
jgi:hypothetical protein